MARREAENLIAKLRQMSEEGAASFFSEVMANEGLRRRLGRAGERFLANKQSFFNHYTLPLGLLVVALAAAAFETATLETGPEVERTVS